ncbi:hypothetical protein PV326_012048 [Microctonus aethiopoides]|nr:hypothetical protein PV326_012048 [Microctonus aethiopoides]
MDIGVNITKDLFPKEIKFLEFVPPHTRNYDVVLEKIFGNKAGPEALLEEFILKFASTKIDRIWNKLPENLQKDEDIIAHRRCHEHYNPIAIDYDEFEGIIPLMKDCSMYPYKIPQSEGMNPRTKKHWDGNFLLTVYHLIKN